MAELDPTILSFYRDRYDEGQRLVQSRHGRLEFQRTQQLLRRQLPAPPATVLDVGGGTGVHARWLAEDGYDVHLIDPVAHHIAQASTYGGFTYAIGDARRLEVADHCFDVTLLLGPLYHLTDAGDRAQALAEAVRVTRAGGICRGGGHQPLCGAAGMGWFRRVGRGGSWGVRTVDADRYQ